LPKLAKKGGVWKGVPVLLLHKSSAEPPWFLYIVYIYANFAGS